MANHSDAAGHYLRIKRELGPMICTLYEANGRKLKRAAEAMLDAGHPEATAYYCRMVLQDLGRFRPRITHQRKKVAARSVQCALSPDEARALQNLRNRTGKSARRLLVDGMLFLARALERQSREPNPRQERSLHDLVGAEIDREFGEEA